MAKLRIALSAQEDLRDIRMYSKLAFGPVIARQYLEGLRATFGLLRDRPYAGAAEEELGEGIRRFTYRSHRVYYRFEADLVLIVRILHHARDVSHAWDAPQ